MFLSKEEQTSVNRTLEHLSPSNQSKSHVTLTYLFLKYMKLSMPSGVLDGTTR